MSDHERMERAEGDGDHGEIRRIELRNFPGFSGADRRAPNARAVAVEAALENLLRSIDNWNGSDYACHFCGKHAHDADCPLTQAADALALPELSR